MLNHNEPFVQEATEELPTARLANERRQTEEPSSVALLHETAKKWKWKKGREEWGGLAALLLGGRGLLGLTWVLVLPRSLLQSAHETWRHPEHLMGYLIPLNRLEGAAGLLWVWGGIKLLLSSSSDPAAPPPCPSHTHTLQLGMSNHPLGSEIFIFPF